jgi:uncharacterized phiE125 gp8 family phage protein
VGVPVSVDEARDACQSLYSGDDARLLQLIEAATAHIDGADGVIGRAIMPQTWKVRIENPGYEIDLPLPPLIAVSTVSMVGSDGISVPLVAGLDGYTVIGGNPATVIIQPDQSATVCEIVYTCGYTAVPESLRLAILMMVRHWYDHPGLVEAGRNPLQPLPMAVDSLLMPYKVQSV